MLDGANLWTFSDRQNHEIDGDDFNMVEEKVTVEIRACGTSSF